MFASIMRGAKYFTQRVSIPYRVHAMLSEVELRALDSFNSL